MTWLKHQTRDAYWQHGSVCEDYSAIKAATLAIGGWGDAYKNTVSHLVENLSGPVKGIVGPWVHKYPHFAVPEPRIGFLQEALRWWDHWLKDIDTGVEEDPAYSAYLMEGVRPKTFYEQREGIWIVEDDWPKGLSWQSVYFKADGGLGEIPETLSHNVKSPQTCGMQSGEYCAIWLGPELPGDQRKDDAMSMCYTSSPLSEDYAIVGAPKVHLKLSSDKPQAQLAVRLTHIHPDGASTRITYGVLNLSHRVSHAKPEPLPLGEAIDVSLTLDQIAYRVPKGHKIRVAVSTSYWPLLWPSPEATTLCLHQGSIDIPLRQSGLNDERVFPPAQTETPWDIEILRPARNARRVIEDMHSGTVTLEILDDFGKNEDRDHGLVSGGIAREWWAIHPDDPLSAHGKTHWTMENGRDGWQTRTESYAEMRADHENYYLTARLEAYENDTLVFEKDLSETIPRHGA
jgi:putative CocE/NonD family hydrolase